MFHYIASTITSSIVSNITSNIVTAFDVLKDNLNKLIPVDEYYHVAHELNERYNITNNIVHYRQELNNVLMSHAFIQIYNRFSVMESFFTS